MEDASSRAKRVVLGAHHGEFCLYRACNAGYRVAKPTIMGDSEMMANAAHDSKEIRDRFWSNVIICDFTECWMWTARKNPAGYGYFRVRGKYEGAHRYSYELCIGDIPVGYYVCHKCDVKGCVNPMHLFAGTESDNVLDAYRKGLIPKPPPGSYYKGAVKTEVVLAIRAKYDGKYGSQMILAREYGLSSGAVSNIVNGLNYRHVKEAVTA